MRLALPLVPPVLLVPPVPVLLAFLAFPSLSPVSTSYCSCMFARRISPFEGSPRASAAEYVLGGMLVKGGMLQTDKLN